MISEIEKDNNFYKKIQRKLKIKIIKIKLKNIISLIWIEGQIKKLIK
jgi:hypothetical protein